MQTMSSVVLGDGNIAKPGTRVAKISGYKFPGIVVALYYTLNGDARCVVECTAEGAAGCQHIFAPAQLRLRNRGE